MKPSKVQPYLERTFGRPLTVDELAAMNAARAASLGGGNAVQAMRAAVHAAVSDRLRALNP
ncbi:MAG: hypothetical protein EOO77_10000 [Oxalobacteraceae bacterium]|nr:MAG: hypothetical protein EOO77_10000 [Oxalobacteraceae bacterium]